MRKCGKKACIPLSTGLMALLLLMIGCSEKHPTFDEVGAAYQADAMSADSKYKGKFVEIRGRLMNWEDIERMNEEKHGFSFSTTPKSRKVTIIESKSQGFASCEIPGDDIDFKVLTAGADTFSVQLGWEPEVWSRTEIDVRMLGKLKWWIPGSGSGGFSFEECKFIRE